jgi:hypothetical protein
MATDIEFGEPEVEVRLGRESWASDQTAVEPIDALVSAFHKSFGKEKAGYRRSVTKFLYPAIDVPKLSDVPEGGSEDERKAELAKLVNRRTSRIAERVNARAAETKTAVHARVIRGVLHMVVGTKPVIERKRKANGGDSSATAGAE